MAHQIFQESQSYRGTWMMYLLLMTELPIIVLVLVIMQTTDSDPNETAMGMAVLVGVSALVFILMMAIRLESRIDEKGVHYRFFPFINKWRTLPKSQIRSLKVINYSPLTDYGGWGIKGNKTTKAFSIIGDMGLLIDTGDKKKIMIGTRKESELKAFLRYWQEENNE
jgi:hypothetical protein